VTPEPDALIRRMFTELARGTADPPGVTRAAYGPGEQFAHDLARREAETLGCETATDAAGFSLDVRSEFEDALTEIRGDLARYRAEIEIERGVSIDLGPEFSWPVAAMAPDLLDALQDAGSACGLDIPRMPSGAGHDAAVAAEMGIPTAMLFVRNARGSHNAEESMDLADLESAVRVVAQFVRRGLDRF